MIYAAWLLIAGFCGLGALCLFWAVFDEEKAG
jgi:hypothetical protein